jgi:N-acetylglutamate synthase-like GNAT family acetyltransferase
MTALMHPHVETGTLLPRTPGEIRSRLGEFVVIDEPDTGGEPGAAHEPGGDRLGGMAALHHYGGGLAEIRSLAVAGAHTGNGFGRRLVEHLIDVAREEGLSRLIALTRTPEFFERLGFSRTEIAALPEKVQKDCVRCPRRERCDETAMVLDL